MQTYPPKTDCSRGFSLVELSIVLIIIGLLVGGIMAGQNLIHATKLRNTMVEVDGFIKAVRMFREQYGELPGDFSRATQVWGSQGASCGASTAKLTCNGDGDGFIEHTPVSNSVEKLRAWQHLGNAGFIEGVFTGAYDSNALRRNVNSPASTIDNGVYEIRHTSTLSPANVHSRTGHFIRLGAVSGQNAVNSVLSPIDVQSIDGKYDDGRANNGEILAQNGANSGNCLTSSNYTLTNERVGCQVFFWLE